MKKFIAWVLIFVLTACLAMPVTAEGDYFDGYAAGEEAGQADSEAGKESAYSEYEQGYVEGYAEGYGEAEQSRGLADGLAAGRADKAAGKEFDDESGLAVMNAAEDYISSCLIGYTTGYMGEDPWWEDENHIDTVLTDCGGTPGKINVRLNEKCIDFGAVWPEKRNDRVMAPVRAILEALGVEVDYDLAARTVTARMDGTLLRHTIGTEFIEIFPGGDLSREPRRLEMDCASYIAGGRTMVPVRFFSEAFGLYVDWDSYYQTVVLLDTEALMASYDGQLTVVNLLLSDALGQYRDGGTYRQILELDAGVDLLDSLNGDRHLDVSGRMERLFNDKAVNAAVDLDLADLLDAAMEGDEAHYLETYERELLELGKKLHLEVIYHQETGKMYVKSPLLDYMTGREAWIAADYGTQLLDGGNLLEQYMMQDVRTEYDWYYNDPITVYDLAKERMDLLVALAGDQNFKKSGNTYTYQPTGQTAEALGLSGDIFTGGYYSTDVPEVDCQLQVTDNGDGTCQYTASLRIRAEDGALTADLRKTGAGKSLAVSLHIRNEFRASLRLTAQTAPAADPIRTMPPTEPVDMGDLYS